MQYTLNQATEKYMHNRMTSVTDDKCVGGGDAMRTRQNHRITSTKDEE